MAKQLHGFSSETAGRIARTVRAYEQGSDDKGGKRRRRRPLDENDEIDIQITSSTAIPAEFNRFEYGWKEVIVNKLGKWQDKPAGRTSASTEWKAYNKSEANNTETGTQGNGINTADLPPEATILPAPGGLVRTAKIRINCDGETELYFEHENAVKPMCEEIPPPP